jgi:hypothetical protein
MTCSQNCDFVRIDAGTKDESAWCGMMDKVGPVGFSRRSGDNATATTR